MVNGLKDHLVRIHPTLRPPPPPTADAPRWQAGYYCEVCDVTLQDSITWLDHINGQKHQRNMGMSMRVECSTLEQVKARIAMNVRRVQLAKSGPTRYDLDARVAALEESEAAEKRAKKQERKKRKLEQRAATEGAPPEVDAETMAAMGFGSFGGSRK